MVEIQRRYNETFLNKTQDEIMKDTMIDIEKILKKKRMFFIAFGTDLTFPEILEKANKGESFDYPTTFLSKDMVVQEIVLNVNDILQKAMKDSNIKTEDFKQE